MKKGKKLPDFVKIKADEMRLLQDILERVFMTYEPADITTSLFFAHVLDFLIVLRVANAKLKKELNVRLGYKESIGFIRFWKEVREHGNIELEESGAELIARLLAYADRMCYSGRFDKYSTKLIESTEQFF